MSCISTKQVIYFNDLKDTMTGNLGEAQLAFENPIQKNDQLWITVGGSNPIDLVTINSANGTVSSASGTATSPAGGSSIGYLVEADGKIKIPYLGKVQAEGLTRMQLESTLTESFKDYTKNPVVNVRFLNYGFSVMGEVNARGRFTMTNERTTILEAISMAGDLTDLARRDNVLVVREINGERNYARVNLLSKELFQSPYYYLKTKDIVYVEPVRAKFVNRTGVPQYLSIIAVGLSLLITIINIKK
ncbi:MAG: polysaccharide biosynthesis/export family protein [Ferruginibacter sp.]